MAGELVFTVQPGVARRAKPISLEEAGFRERSDLQEWIRANPEILGPGIKIVTFEFAAWQARDRLAADRLDLLGLDDDGRLVVAELKRGPAPDTVEMQAIKYAAFASRFTPATLAERHAEYLTKVVEADGPSVTTDEAAAQLEDHVGGELDPDLLGQPRIVLVAASFPPQVTASAVWLTEMGVNVSLIEFNAYRTEHDIVLTVSQIWPVADVEDFTVSPREVARRAADERVRTRRETNAVITLVVKGTLEDGEPLTLDVNALPARTREQVAAWVSENPTRGRATWRNDRRAPLTWVANGQPWSPTGLAKEIIAQATGERRAVLAGPSVWKTTNDESLAALAGFKAGAGGRDWTDLHKLLEQVRPGEWTTYGDLADAIGSAAQPVGRHVAGCDDCPAAYRVLRDGGEVAPGFTWDDATETRTAVEVLESEGVEFVGGRASATQRIDASTLRERMASG